MQRDGSPNASGLRVMKFGGSSVGRTDSLVRVIDIVANELERGPVAAVVSAMGDTTDWLIDAAAKAATGERELADHVVDTIASLALGNGTAVLDHLRRVRGMPTQMPDLLAVTHDVLAPLRQVLYGVSLLRECSAQTLDLVMSFGERLSASVIAELMKVRGIPALYVDSRTWTVTDDRFGNALVDWEATHDKVITLTTQFAGHVPIVTGFLGQTADGRTTTLGRNGSDYTATLLARGLGAAEVNIWTDVSGVMTADPSLVADAYPLERLSYTEALELANFGARMFHPRTMIPLIESGIPMRIRNTMHPEQSGTLVDREGVAGTNRPTSVTSLENLALLSVQWRRLSHDALVGERVLRALVRARVTVWMTVQAAHGQAVAVAIPAAQVDHASAAIQEELALELERREAQPLDVRQPVTLLTLVAETMSETANVAGRFFAPLGAVGVNVRAIAQGASSRSISCVIDAEHTAVAVRTVHAAFNFAHQTVSVLLLGKGTVGRPLIEQIREQQAKLLRRQDVRLDVVGIVDTRRSVFDPSGISLDDWQAQLEGSGRARHDTGSELVDLLDRLRRLSVPVLVDCTTDADMAARYLAAFERGIHVVTANKKPLSRSWRECELLTAAARHAHRAFRYETTICASLALVETVRDFVDTGDRVRLVEGAMSGAMSYVSHQVSSGVRLSEAVLRAKELGYTEPDPWDDVSGLDVARKALILAREMGMEISLEDVAIEPFVPGMSIHTRPAPGRLYERLRELDELVAERARDASKSAHVVRHLARIEYDPDGRSPRVCVGPRFVAADHPAARVTGAEACVAFYTERYRACPLIVQGPDAGGPVAAAGVLADILEIAESLRHG